MALRIQRANRGKATAAHAHAPKQERGMAKALGGKVTPGSGCGRIKGDVRITGVARLECKGTLAKSFAVTREMVAKIEEAALSNGAELPFIQIDFLAPDGSVSQSVVVAPLYALNSLLDASS